MFKVGDVVTDRLAKGWHGTIISIEGDPQFGHRAVISVGGIHTNFWYPISWLKHVEPIATDCIMADTREYLQTVAGGK